METFELVGYLGAFVIGLVMGITGSGGSAMAVPIFNYLFLMDMHATTAHSLFVVGISATAGVLLHLRQGSVDWRMAFFLSLPMVVTVFLIRGYLLPMVPNVLFHINGLDLDVTRDLTIMSTFGILMAFAAIWSIRKERTEGRKMVSSKKPAWAVLSMGIGIGAITGFTGTGGGFLIVPVLVFFLGCPIKKAIITSLLIVALKSFIGFAGDVGSVKIDWVILWVFTGISLFGMTLGIFSAHRIAEKSLKRGYSYVVLGISVLVLGKELVQLV